MDSLEAPLLERLETLKAEEAEAEKVVEEARERAKLIIAEADEKRREVANERRRIDKALKVLRDEPLSQPKKPEPRKGSVWAVSDTVLSNVREAVLRLTNESEGFFFYELAAESPHADQTTKLALEELREQHVVRRAGQRDAGSKRGKMDWWVADDDELVALEDQAHDEGGVIA